MQSVALIIDSWRLLRSRKLFWVTLGINLLVVVLYGSIGFTPKGMTILFGLTSFESDRFRIGMPLAREIYLALFSEIIVTLWLGWIAAALAVISTASIFPDFLSEGSIDIVLAKPITRLRVFLVKYLGSLLFVLAQVATFCIGAFFCIGARLGEWNLGLFMAIPLIVLFFSYIYCVNVLVGVLTRSTLAALIVTALFWFMLWTFHTATDVTRQITYNKEAEVARLHQRVDQLQATYDDLVKSGLDSSSNQFERARGLLESARADLEGESETAVTANRWLWGMRLGTAALPKHHGTIDLVDRWVGKDPQRSITDILMNTRPPHMSQDEFDDQRQVVQRIEKEQKSESALWIIGTSLGFEAVVLAIAAWFFSRKDF